jgi:preprotein translocase subunit YajC
MPVLAAAATTPAVGGAPAGGGGASALYPMGTMFLLLAIMYFLILRPQQVKAKQHREMVSRVKVGDKVITTAGIFGEVAGVAETSLMLKIAPNVEIKVVSSAVSTVLTTEDSEASAKPAGGKPVKKK